MKQLVELQKEADRFAALNTELIFVFREEREGVEGLKKIQERTKSKFTLAVDLGAKQTSAYSPKTRTFDNYVIDKKGTIRGVIDGTLRVRASAEQLLKILEGIEDQ